MKKIEPINVIQCLLIIGAIILGCNNSDGWGWFLFIFLLTL